MNALANIQVDRRVKHEHRRESSTWLTTMLFMHNQVSTDCEITAQLQSKLTETKTNCQVSLPYESRTKGISNSDLLANFQIKSDGILNEYSRSFLHQLTLIINLKIKILQTPTLYKYTAISNCISTAGKFPKFLALRKNMER